MKMTVEHRTLYHYSRAVWLQPHIIRLRPRDDGSVRLDRFDIRITPEPSMLAQSLDLEGNAVLHAWFSDMTESLQIETRSELETLRGNPFDYLLAARGDALPVAYEDAEQHLAAPYLRRAEASGPVTEFARKLAEANAGRTLDFLNALNGEIYGSCRIAVRETGAPHPASRTLDQREGSCRDVAVLFIEACRSVGIAARFVSGYQRGDPGRQELYMHAWPEVYLPGAGWRGYDPTHGLAVADQHVAVAACREPFGATPVEGTFRGTDATARMEAQVVIS
jgi:transglutaminase-like putative cysteine protease